MSDSLSLEVFQRLRGQVIEIRKVAEGLQSTNATVAHSLRRSAYVLSVAALDTYFHEKAAARLYQAACADATGAARVANYVQSVSAADVSGVLGESYIKLRLSYKTLVAPRTVNSAIAAWGDDADAVWMKFALSNSSRPDREQRQLELVYDRRNQIAHEADWDSVQLDFRPMEEAHLADCLSTVTRVAEGFDKLI
ncbi:MULTISPECIES: hypothetical protein [Curtobacterium]|uniref:hypothetical protein n=1 Tax=Curtobacterium TaxID=2034 RepID=UPI00217CF8C6|nr:hypothetical protein [Curtobacterium flaccumfaciens]MCS6581781.1 hypothetical protein [Curtobacterium flaccumfaciens pv. beticola]